MKGESILKEAGQRLNKSLTQELRDQGHFLTGSLEASINNSFRVEVMKKQYVLRGFALDYSVDLDEGKSAGSRSLPSVEELRRYFLLRGLSPGEAEQAAVLTARRHKKEGMPTKASSRFSKTGERKNFIRRAWSSVEQKINSYIDGASDNIFKAETDKQKSETI